MGKRLYFKFQIIWILIVIPLLTYIYLKKTLNLALYGDDWEQLYNLWLSFDVYKTSSFFNINSYLSPYWPQYLFLGIIRHFSGYEPIAYFASSLFLRILATISLFFLMKKMTKKSLPAYLSTIIFTFSAAGLQTTDWVFNMNTYAGVFFLNLSIIFYLKLNNPKVQFFLRYIFFVVLFTLALSIVPVRMHGAVIFLGMIEFIFSFFIQKDRKFRPDKFFFLRILTPIIILFVLIKLGSFGNSGDNLPLKTGFTYLVEMIQKGRYDVFFYFFGIIGNFVFPDTATGGVIFGRLSLLGLCFILADSILVLTLRGGKKMLGYFFVFNILEIFLGKLLLFWNPLLSSTNIISILMGIHLITVPTILFWQLRKTNLLQVASIIIGLIWLISFSFLYWVRTPYLIIETTGRYMTMGAFGFSILFASLLWLIIERSSSRKRIKMLTFFVPMVLLVFWLKINLEAANIYLTNLEENRNINLANKAWDVLLQNVPAIDKENPSVFYFSTDNPTAIYMIFSFGFPPHGGLLYGITDWLNTPIPTEHYEELLKMVSSGETLAKLHGRKPNPVPISRVFAFDFRNGELINITDQIRQKITEDLKNN
ncbi:hypothetical protein HYW41_01890 [Candidatus Daviesbacteria bacterium]|nr:hypothetical protein [Candidatus Daviesbacteria bacterium]